MTTMNCQNCNVGYGPDDMFCENCGYDFITGSLPVDGAATASGAPSPAAGSPPAAAGPPSGAESPPTAVGASGQTASPDAGAAPPSILNEESAGGDGAAGPTSSPTGGQATAADVPRLTITVAVDRSFFDEVVNDGEIDFPDPVPVDQELELAGSELHIGRTSDSRAIHPDIDVADLTGDQAVSSRHAVLRVSIDGSFTIVDVGSTNGTFLDSVDSEAIIHGVPMEVKAGVPIYVGAWTRLTIAE